MKLKIETVNWTRKSYAVVGERRGRIVWWCARISNPHSLRNVWSVDDGWAVVMGSIKAIKPILKHALAHEDSKSVENISVVALTTKTTLTTKRVKL